MPDQVESLAYYGEVPWHRRGTRVPKHVVAAEMICAAGLDWAVEKRPARGAFVDKKGKASLYEIVRMPRGESEEEMLLGVVSDRYEPLQNKEAFAFFDPIVREDRASFETAGSLRYGQRVWVMARMPGDIEVVPGDGPCRKYLLLSNSHTGRGAVTVKFTSVRVVCANTLMLALKDGQSSMRVRHSRLMSEKLSQISEIMTAATALYSKAAEVFKRMAATHLDAKGLDTYLDLVFPRKKTQETNGGVPRRWKDIRRILRKAEDLQRDGVKNTLWAAYNAITALEDHPKLAGANAEDEYLDRSWFGSGADHKVRALRQAEILMGAA